MTIDEICAEVRADTTGYVGPAIRALPAPIDVVAVFATAAPDSYEEIMRSGDDGRCWTEHGRLYGTCATCHLERPTTSMVSVDGRWYCENDARCQP